MTLAITPEHSRLLEALGRSTDTPRVVVIGATALNHHLPLRPTADVDLVVVADSNQVARLVGAQGWRQDPKLLERWWLDDASIDVLPATPAAIDAGFVMMGDGHKLSTLGIDVALTHSTRVPVPLTNVTVDVASLASIVLLKMVAVLDRPHERQKDLADIGHVFEAVLADWEDRRWEQPLADIEYEEQGAYFTGLLVRAETSSVHREAVDRFLQEIARRGWEGVIGAGGLVCTDPSEVAQRRLAAFRRAVEQ